MKPTEGLLIALEGLDFSGKNTQQRLLDEWLCKKGYQVLSTREPGGTPLGEEIRRLLLLKKHVICAKAELLLFMASRAEFVRDILIPELSQGKIVITSRYFFSSLAYQGYARELSIPSLLQITDFVIEGLVPDLTILIDLEVDKVFIRRGGNQVDRIEEEGRAFFERARNGFLELSKDRRWNVRVVDGDDSVENIHSRIIALIQGLL